MPARLRRSFVIAAAIAAISCGPPSAPSVPSAPAAPPAPRPLPSPAPSLDVNGEYTLTFTAADDCDQLQPEHRQRTYMAALSREQTFSGAFVFKGELSGASFVPDYETFFGRVDSDSVEFYVSSLAAYNRWLDEEPIFERIGTGYLSIVGYATFSPLTFGQSEVVAEVNGTFAYCSRAQPAGPGYPPPCDVPRVSCRSQHHHLAVSRR